VVRDPELKKIPNGTSVVNLSIATSRTYKKDDKKVEEVEFHNTVGFGKTADIIGQYLKKGQLVSVTGRLVTRSWDKDGVKMYRTEIVIEQMQMGPKPGGSTKPEEGKVETIEYPDNDDINPDDIPF
jgi:single-strand DNA-binding protein